MANKASKSLARQNALTLNRTHMISLALNTVYILYRLLFRSGSWKKYMLLSLPALGLEYYLERLGRPVHAANGELVKPGEDMAAQGVTEYCWDVVYVTWIVLGLAGVTGEWAWWIMAIVPAYGAFLAWGLYRKMSGGGMLGMEDAGEGAGEGGQSKRQKKMEARGGKVRYR